MTFRLPESRTLSAYSRTKERFRRCCGEIISAMKVAYFGVGLLGTGFVRGMLDRGDEVRVWNRTHAKARSLEEHGAIVYEDPFEAIDGVDELHLTLADDASVDGVLEPLA